jgi:SagB-type dehydrogenase family enzyme
MSDIMLPKPRVKGAVSVEEAIGKRRSVRDYSARGISAEDLSQLLWACQGVTDKANGLRAAPSAGALYPLEVYVVKADGVFRYLPGTHALRKISDKDVRRELADSSRGQRFFSDVPVDIVITAVYGRTTSRYGDRGVRYAMMEAGHAAQNVFIQAVGIGLDSVAVGAFDDGAVSGILGLPKDEEPLYILPIGYRR